MFRVFPNGGPSPFPRTLPLTRTIACTNPALTSSLLFPQSMGPFKVEVEDGVAYAVVVDVVTPIVAM